MVSHDAEPDRPMERGFVTLSTLRVGIRPMIEKGGEKRRAEILSIQTRKGEPVFYVHYEGFNKRLDEWITADRVDLSQEVEWPAPEKDVKKKEASTTKSQPAQKTVPTQKAPKNLKRSRTALEREDSGNVPGKAPRPPRAGGKENREDVAIIVTEVIDGSSQPGDEQMDVDDVQDAAAAAKSIPSDIPYSREHEIEKLRTSGSMTQNQAEISRVRNLSKVQMGHHEIEPWYFSPYPQEFTECDMVYICEFCLDYFPDLKPFTRHRAKCTLQHPPGNEIYRDDYVSCFEIDGRRQRTWCRNLCLLSKLFLDHKTLYYDVDPFLFYCMCTRDAHGCHLVGYFSKEKESADNYNVACILTLPQYQRKGFGRLLIAFSYELTKRQGGQGSPEKPLSDLGLLSYRAYWSEMIVDLLQDEKLDAEPSIEMIALRLAMQNSDVVHSLNAMNMLKSYRNQHVIILTEAAIQQRERAKEKEKIKGRRFIDPDKLVWKPPVFPPSSRTWNW